MSWLKRDRLQYEFLPAAEEIIEMPAAPLGALVVWLVAFLLVVALAWSYIGRIDIVAVANGKISTEGSTKIIQPAISGVVTSINVHEGQRVKKGETLLVLDKTTAEKDVATVNQSLNTARVERDILRRLAVGGNTDDIINNADLPDEAKAMLRQFAGLQTALSAARQQAANGTISNYQQQLQFNQQAKNQLETNAQNLKNRKAEIEKQLPNANPVDKLRLQNELSNIDQRITSADSAVLGQNQQLLQSQSALTQAQNQSQTQIAETNSAFNNQIITAEKRIIELENNLVKAKQILAQTTITAPVDGTILSLTVKTIGGVVNAGQQLAQIVPEKVPLYVDAALDNQDIGFVKSGQRVVVKVATYPFQRYGYLEGTVENISPDAIQDDKKGLIYKAKIKLNDDKSSKQNQLKLLPGMSVSAEITTGQRRIIEFFLDPLITKTEDSLKVR
ncbi:HlyD family type I secretion periplasmic adaptor subunit [Candidatus Nanosynbacter featherlites]|uniref:HlyD family type I secretion periplasmic adaptor subunit n=1 Tax=Candidatus Nanosynbacter featherlites TaxID=2572088 RepID=A0A4P9A3N4_9BACT|nr:HlyD family type I secretion periplasmic adaptor subunit [Candidatus Nanosynbacter featherlites]QCT42425.1 HlyD family type I secretion periplasmic adaptor subunit [Candidatus Nanosynbacter featherlites]